MIYWPQNTVFRPDDDMPDMILFRWAFDWYQPSFGFKLVRQDHAQADLCMEMALAGRVGVPDVLVDDLDVERWLAVLNNP